MHVKKPEPLKCGGKTEGGKVFCHAKVRLNMILRIQVMYRDIRNQRGVEYVSNREAGLPPALDFRLTSHQKAESLLVNGNRELQAELVHFPCYI
jgi:hypothetical protein